MNEGEIKVELIENVLHYALSAKHWDLAATLVDQLPREQKQDVLRGSRNRQPLRTALEKSAPPNVRRSLIPELPQAETLARLLSRGGRGPVPIEVFE